MIWKGTLRENPIFTYHPSVPPAMTSTPVFPFKFLTSEDIRKDTKISPTDWKTMGRLTYSEAVEEDTQSRIRHSSLPDEYKSHNDYVYEFSSNLPFVCDMLKVMNSTGKVKTIEMSIRCSESIRYRAFRWSEHK
jgi:hypothetical protein